MSFGSESDGREGGGRRRFRVINDLGPGEPGTAPEFGFVGIEFGTVSWGR